MARPKGKLFALLAVFVAIGLATATGAFTSVQADRTATVNVAGDQAALLQLDPVSSVGSDGNENDDPADADVVTDNDQDFVDYSNGQIVFDIEGINTNAKTNLSYVFQITNNGEDEVDVTIDDSSLYDGNSNASDGNIVFYTGDNSTAIEGDDGVTLDTGKSVKVGIIITVGNFNPGGSSSTSQFLNGDLVITAEATDN